MEWLICGVDDGTLSPIVDQPSDAFFPEATRELVQQLATKFPTSIVTGRSMETVTQFVQLDTVHYAASHGFDVSILQENGTRQSIQMGQEFLPLLGSLAAQLKDIESDARFSGCLVEDNTFSISIHYRNLINTENVALLESHIDATMGTENYQNTLVKTYGKKVFEIRPSMVWHKGKAVDCLRKSLYRTLSLDPISTISIYIGDDVTDEDAFKVLRHQDIGVLVSKEHRDTAAMYRLEDTDQVVFFLQRLALL